MIYGFRFGDSCFISEHCELILVLKPCFRAFFFRQSLSWWVIMFQEYVFNALFVVLKPCFLTFFYNWSNLIHICDSPSQISPSTSPPQSLHPNSLPSGEQVHFWQPSFLNSLFGSQTCRISTGDWQPTHSDPLPSGEHLQVPVAQPGCFHFLFGSQTFGSTGASGDYFCQTI